MTPEENVALFKAIRDQVSAAAVPPAVRDDGDVQRCGGADAAAARARPDARRGSAQAGVRHLLQGDSRRTPRLMPLATWRRA